ncbi:MAG: type II and III secretion system protein family protein [Pseudomonadota bacterium]|nr:type II and III secretion system protein family protein [Pseudomonadota bacterium]
MPSSKPASQIRCRTRAGALPALMIAAAAMLGLPQDSLADQGVREVSVPLYKSITLRPERPAQRIAVGNPGVADIVVLGGGQVQVVGKALGATNVVLWDAGGKVLATYDVEVTHDLATLKAKLHALLPGEPIEVRSAQENILLSGQVGSLSRMQAALAMVESFIPECVKAQTQDEESKRTIDVLPGTADGRDCGKGKVINLMQVGGAQQVMVQVTVAEMSRTVLKSMDADFNIFNLGRRAGVGAVQGGASFPNALNAEGLQVPLLGDLGGGASPIGPVVDLFDPSTPAINASGIFFSYLRGDLFLQAVLEISRRKGLAKILSEPTLTTLSGQQAEFLSGGEFPIPVPQAGGGNSVTIEFKEFGVGVRFLPVVLDSGRINMRLNVSVSEISQDNAVALSPGGTSSSFVIPSLTKRSAISTVELANGQTIGIAGLISDNVREYVDKLPGLGDIPGLGALFRSQEFRSGQTELVIFVTPHLARPIAPDQVRLPTDSFVPPSDREFYLMGRMEAKNTPTDRQPRSSKGGPEGARFGHDLQGVAP